MVRFTILIVFYTFISKVKITQCESLSWHERIFLMDVKSLYLNLYENMEFNVQENNQHPSLGY